jgi:hypothetical protein
LSSHTIRAQFAHNSHIFLAQFAHNSRTRLGLPSDFGISSGLGSSQARASFMFGLPCMAGAHMGLTQGSHGQGSHIAVTVKFTLVLFFCQITMRMGTGQRTNSYLYYNHLKFLSISIPKIVDFTPL